MNPSYGSVTDLESADLFSDTTKQSTTLLNETKIILKSSLPLAITFFLQYSLSVVSIFTVSRIGKVELAAVSLATMTFNITSSIFTGMSTSLETLCSQAYGAKNFKLVGLYYQRCFTIILIFNLPLILIWWYSGFFLKFIVIDENLAILAQSYLRIMIFSTPAYIFFETTKRFLQSQNIFVAGQYVLFIVSPINIILNYLLVWNKYIGLGFIGAPLATTISYWIGALLLLSYIYFIKGNECWYGFNLKQCFQNWSSILPLALNGTAMLLSEFIAFEILTLSSAKFGTSTLAAQSIASTLATLSFQIPFSVSVATSTRIANLLGANLKLNSIISKNASYLISLFLSILNFSLLFFTKNFIIKLFTNDIKVINLSIKILKILSINQLYDCPNIIGAGILRAQGRQEIGSKLNLLCYYIIAIPLALYLGFNCNLKVTGLWIGLGIGVFCLSISEFVMISRSDWDSIIENANDRSRIDIN